MTPPTVLDPASYADMVETFEGFEYGWDLLDQGVPPMILQSMPVDLHQVPRVAIRKQVFYLSLLPMALMLNEEVDKQRRQLERISKQLVKQKPLNQKDQTILQELAEHYKVSGDPASQPALKELSLRIDTLPPSLLLAQAANESGYGTSRFAQEANNLFGEWTFTPGTGLVPEGRPEGETYEVRVFASVHDSLKSYMRNINTHWAYNSLRQERARLRSRGEVPTGVQLAGGLELYSTRRGAYVDEIRAMIRNNDLERLGSAELRQRRPLERYGRPSESALRVAAAQ